MRQQQQQQQQQNNEASAQSEEKELPYHRFAHRDALLMSMRVGEDTAGAPVFVRPCCCVRAPALTG